MMRSKILLSCICGVGLFCLFGCGHSSLTVDRGTGFVARIPLVGTNSNIVELKLGNIDSATAVLRGGATVSADVAKGGTFGTVSSGDHITMSTIPGVNEGYVEKILTSPHADPGTKQALVQYLASAKPATPPPSAVSSVNAGAANGATNPPEVKAVSTGVDKAIETAGDVAPKVVPPMVDGVKSVSSDMTSAVKDVSDDTFSAIPKIIQEAKWLIVTLAVLLLVGGAAFLWFRSKKKKKATSAKASETPVKETTVAVETHTEETKPTSGQIV